MPANTDYQDGGYTVFSNISLNGTSGATFRAGTLQASLLSSTGTVTGVNVMASQVSSTGTIVAGGVIRGSAFSSDGTSKTGDVWTSRLSIGGSSSAYTGTQILASSYATCVVPAHVVQGSASSFTVFVWPAVRIGDLIMVAPLANPGVSSISSGLILHSHCTQNGQCEFRYSNVSTLVQNQSAQTVGFFRWCVA